MENYQRKDKDNKLTAKEHIEIAMYILDKQLYFISAVDTRASMLLASNIGLAAIVVSFVDLTKWQSLVAGVFSIIGIIISTVFTFTTIRPSHIDTPSPDTLIYWGHISRKKLDVYIRELKTAQSNKIMQDISSQTHTLSIIVDYKYRKMKFAVDTFAISAIMTLALIIIKNILN